MATVPYTCRKRDSIHRLQMTSILPEALTDQATTAGSSRETFIFLLSEVKTLKSKIISSVCTFTKLFLIPYHQIFKFQFFSFQNKENFYPTLHIQQGSFVISPKSKQKIEI